MADLLQDGLTWLGDRLTAHAGRAVVYRRASTDVAVTATVGRTLLRLTDEYGQVRVVWTDRDYLLHSADLAAGGVSLPPQRGDRVRDASTGTTEVYEVLAPAGEPHWKPCDGSGDVIRVHTKRVE